MKKFVVCMLIICFMASSMVFVSAAPAQPAPMTITAKSAILMDAGTGKVLFEQNPDERLPIASVTKIMTMLLVMEALDSGKIKYEDTVVASANACGMGGSQVFLQPNESMTVKDMLKAIAVASANDASVAMAEHLTGSEQTFIAEMNAKAEQLGMKNTHFINTNGLDVDDHYSSAKDVALMSRELITKHPKVLEFTNIWMDTLRNGAFGLSNTNKLIRFYTGATGLKTGSTSKALYCLSATAKRNNMHLISVVIAAPTSKDRFADATKILDYGFANYAVAAGVKKDEVLGEGQISKGLQKSVSLVADNDCEILVAKGKQGNVKKEVVIDTQLAAPIVKGQKVGEVVLKMDGQEIGKTDIVAANSVDKYSFVNVMQLIVNHWVNIKS
ncbi:MAG: D-alanyl-D-alanine carboxypeptidase [Hyphomonadaceae bacterium]|nr:D-alanyl-D-alanine carboxypeptidase [Clostridia bacterium]